MARWWETESGAALPHADRLLLLTDAEGSEGWCLRQWAYQVQVQLSDRCRLTVTLRHIQRAARSGI
jgi:hypothetical protein